MNNANATIQVKDEIRAVEQKQLEQSWSKPKKIANTRWRKSQIVSVRWTNPQIGCVSVRWTNSQIVRGNVRWTNAQIGCLLNVSFRLDEGCGTYFESVMEEDSS